MLNQLPVPVLADLEWLGGAVLLAIWIISQLSSLFANKKQGPPAKGPRAGQPAPPQKAGGDRISDEIEIFLEQITGKKPAQKKPVQKQPRQATPVAKPRRLTPSGQTPARSSQQRKSQPPKKTQKPQKPKRVRPSSRISKREVSDSSQLGKGVRSHVSEHMEEGRISDHVATHLDHDVIEGVREHLGAFGGDDAARFATAGSQKQKTSAAASQIIDLLRDPAGVRQAILINEILSPPLGSRRRS